ESGVSHGMARATATAATTSYLRLNDEQKSILAVDGHTAQLEPDFAALLAGDRGDVLRDRLDLLRRQLALEGRHDALAVRHAVDDTAPRGLPLVEVRPTRPGRAGVLQRVTAGAAGGEEDRLAVGGRDLSATGAG